MEYIYAITDGVNIKIGISKHPLKRLKQLSTGHPLKLSMLGYFEGNRDLEQQIHRMFKKTNSNKEWHEPNEELLNYLNDRIENSHIGWVGGKLMRLFKMRK